MTLSALLKMLKIAGAQGHTSMHVLVDKSSFTDPREGDGCIFLPITGVDIRCINEMDGDGSLIINKDGSERVRTVIALHGAAYKRE